CRGARQVPDGVLKGPEEVRVCIGERWTLLIGDTGPELVDVLPSQQCQPLLNVSLVDEVVSSVTLLRLEEFGQGELRHVVEGDLPKLLRHLVDKQVHLRQ